MHPSFSTATALRRFSLPIGLALLMSQFVAGSALAVPTVYDFTTGPANQVPSNAAATALAGLTVSGSFTYDADAALVAQSALASVYAGFANLSGAVGGHSFADSSGAVQVLNEGYSPPVAGAPFDLMQLAAEPTLGAIGNYNLTGFALPALALANVRLFWIETVIGNAPDFLANNDLLPTLPAFSGRLALDFVASPYNPIDGTPSPVLSALTSVFFDGLTVRARAVAVMEPAVVGLFACALALLVLLRHRGRIA